MAEHIPSSTNEDVGNHSHGVPLWRSKITVSTVLVLAVVLGTWWLFRWLSTTPAPTPHNDLTPVHLTAPSQSSKSLILESDSALIVHVIGEVQAPGVYELPEGARVIDALDEAGGMTDQAHVESLNLAALVTDGQQIVVLDHESGPSAGDSGLMPAALPGGGAGTVNLNTAPKEELETLPGVGPATSQNIIDHRQAHGPFRSLDDLDAVPGIGPATLARLESLVSW